MISVPVETELCFLSATALLRLLRSRVVSARELVSAHLAQIARVNPAVNALVTLREPDLLFREAAAVDEALASGRPVGLLAGLPVAHKDLARTRGLRTTFGSPILADFVPKEDSLIVERLKSAGAITVGKANTSEFGVGAQTFNPVFGATRNPYDHSKTCGGSSGGSAVALACGMVPIADGSDCGGSLRNPASFCNVVGFRPTPGRVPVWPTDTAWSTLSVQGPMARTVEDIALLMQVMAGPDARAPLALTDPGALFAQPLARDLRGTRVAWSPDVGGLPFDPCVPAALAHAPGVFADLGCHVEQATPDFTDAHEAFTTLRAAAFQERFSRLLETSRHLLKDTIIQNTEEGLRLTGADLNRAEVQRTALYHRLRVFFERYDYLILPVSQVPPFDVTEPWVRSIAGVPMPTYMDWMKSCYYLSPLGLPAISVPCGFTPDGLPVGLQIVGRIRDDVGVLQLAYGFEQATRPSLTRPAID